MRSNLGREEMEVYDNETEAEEKEKIKFNMLYLHVFEHSSRQEILQKQTESREHKNEFLDVDIIEKPDKIHFNEFFNHDWELEPNDDNNDPKKPWEDQERADATFSRLRKRIALFEKKLIEETPEKEHLDLLMRLWKQEQSEKYQGEMMGLMVPNHPQHRDFFHVNRRVEFCQAMMRGLQQDRDNLTKLQNFFGYYQAQLQQLDESSLDPFAPDDPLDFLAEADDQDPPTQQEMLDQIVEEFQEDAPAGPGGAGQSPLDGAYDYSLLGRKALPLKTLENMVNYVFANLPDVEVLAGMIREGHWDGEHSSSDDGLGGALMGSGSTHIEHFDMQTEYEWADFESGIERIVQTDRPAPGGAGAASKERQDSEDTLRKRTLVKKMLFIEKLRRQVELDRYRSAGIVDSNLYVFLSQNRKTLETHLDAGLDIEEAVEALLNKPIFSRKPKSTPSNPSEAEREDSNVDWCDLEPLLQNPNLLMKITKFQAEVSTKKEGPKEWSMRQVLEQVRATLGAIEEPVSATVSDKVQEFIGNNHRLPLMKKFDSFVKVEMIKKKILSDMHQFVGVAPSLEVYLDQDRRSRGIERRPMDYYEALSTDARNNHPPEFEADQKNLTMTQIEKKMLKELDELTKTRVYRPDGSYYYQSNIGHDEVELLKQLENLFRIRRINAYYKDILNDPKIIQLKMDNRQFELTRQIEFEAMSEVSKESLYFATLGHPAVTGNWYDIKQNPEINLRLFENSNQLAKFGDLGDQLGAPRFLGNVAALSEISPNAESLYKNFEKNVFFEVYEMWNRPQLLGVEMITKNIVDQLVAGKDPLPFLEVDVDHLKPFLDNYFRTAKIDHLEYVIHNMVSMIDVESFAEQVPLDERLLDELQLEDYLWQSESSAKTDSPGYGLLDAHTIFMAHVQDMEDSLKFNPELVSDEKQYEENQRMIQEYNKLNPNKNIMDLLAHFYKFPVKSLTMRKDPSVIPLEQAQLGLNLDDFHSLRVMRTPADLHVRNIREIFELYLMRRHPKVSQALEKVGMDPDELELRLLPNDQMEFMEDLLLKTRAVGLDRLVEHARVFYNLTKGGSAEGVNGSSTSDDQHANRLESATKGARLFPTGKRNQPQF